MPPLRKLEQRVALVTGATRGIGRAIVIGLAEAGAAVLLAESDYMTGQTISVNGGWYMT